MMWKESYRVGIECIDSQHYQLFKMVDELVRTFAQADAKQRKASCKQAIAFLKDYVIKHFREEENYQAAVHYYGIENHKKEHRNFIKTVVDYEKKFIANDYELTTIKEFAGTLVAWLIYHVAKEDQKIAKGEELADKSAGDSYANCFGKGAAAVLKKMAAVETVGVHTIANAPLTGEIFVNVGLIGDVEGEAVFAFSQELAFQLIKSMTFMDVTEVDELVCSAMSEISNIISGSAATQMLKQELHCDIKPPVVTVGCYLVANSNANTEMICVDTVAGSLQIAVMQ